MTTTKEIRKILAGGVECNIISDGWLTRRQDDTDGSTAPEHEISVAQSLDGDMYVRQGFNTALRFRNFFGGGISLHTYNALRILAEAIKMDREKYKQENL